MMRAVVVVLAVVMASGCALRPRYGDFVQQGFEGKELELQVVDADSGAPVAGAKIEVGEGKSKLALTSGVDGAFRIPVDKRYADENSILVVTLPKGTTHYRVEPLPVRVLAPPPPQEAPQESVDAGVSPSNG